MSSTLWLSRSDKSKIVVNSLGEILLCEKCPCGPIQSPGPIGDWFCGCDLVQAPTLLRVHITSSGICSSLPDLTNNWQDRILDLSLIDASIPGRLIWLTNFTIDPFGNEGFPYYFSCTFVTYGFGAGGLDSCKAILTICANGNPNYPGSCERLLGGFICYQGYFSNTLTDLVTCLPDSEFPYVFPMHPFNHTPRLCCGPPFLFSSVECDITIDALA